MRQITQRILQRFAGLIAFPVPYAHVVSPEVEVRTEIDWAHPDRRVVAAPAGAVAFVKVHDRAGDVVDLALEPVIAFALERYKQKTIRIRNQHDRDVTPGWYTEDAEPITASGDDWDSVVAIAYILPDCSVVCGTALGHDRYASLDLAFAAYRRLNVVEKENPLM